MSTKIIYSWLLTRRWLWIKSGTNYRRFWKHIIFQYEFSFGISPFGEQKIIRLFS